MIVQARLDGIDGIPRCFGICADWNESAEFVDEEVLITEYIEPQAGFGHEGTMKWISSHGTVRLVFHVW